MKNQRDLVTRESIVDMYMRAQKYAGETGLYFILPEATELLLEQGKPVSYPRQVPRLHIEEYIIAPQQDTKQETQNAVYSELVDHYDDVLLDALEHEMQKHPNDPSMPSLQQSGFLKNLLTVWSPMPTYTMKSYSVLPFARRKNNARRTLQALDKSEQYFSLKDYNLATTSVWHDLLACGEWDY